MLGTMIIIYLTIGFLISIASTICVIDRRKKKTNSIKTSDIGDLYFWTIVAVVTLIDAICWPYIVIEAVENVFNN